MENCSFEIQIETQDELKSLICQDYWHLNRSKKYTYQVRDIAYKYAISMISVTEISSKNSKFIIKCKRCKDVSNEYSKRSDFKLEEVIFGSLSICEKCFYEIKTEKEKLISNPQKQKPFDTGKKFEKMENSFQDKLWKELNEMELETLIQIAESENKTEIYEKIFYNNKEIGGSYRYKIWSRVNKLESIHLIWVERNNENKIIEFHILEKLKNELKLKYPELFIYKN